MERLLVIDDELVTLELMRVSLSEAGYHVDARPSLEEIPKPWSIGQWDCIICDYFLGNGQTGAELLTLVRQSADPVPFIFLTSNAGLRTAIDSIQAGANDYLLKPFELDMMLLTIQRNIRAAADRRILRQLQQEKIAFDAEKHQIIHWREMYGAKETRQTEMMIRQLARSVNRTGGYEWMDMIQADRVKLENGKVALSEEILDMVLDITREQKKIMEYLNFIGKIDKVDFAAKAVTVTELFGGIHNLLVHELAPLARKHHHELILSLPSQIIPGHVNLESRYLPSIVRELVINAIKYSPPESLITIYPAWNQDKNLLQLVFANDALPTTIKGPGGELLTGIPYEYCEQIFDMFYTLDSAGHSLECEEWTDGTGLYICRKLMKRMGGWIRAANANDFHGEKPQVVVNLTLEFPLLDS
jgi:DNA-binding response OmpR family regulator